MPTYGMALVLQTLSEYRITRSILLSPLDAHGCLLCCEHGPKGRIYRLPVVGLTLSEHARVVICRDPSDSRGHTTEIVHGQGGMPSAFDVSRKAFDDR